MLSWGMGLDSFLVLLHSYVTLWWCKIKIYCSIFTWVLATHSLLFVHEICRLDPPLFFEHSIARIIALQTCYCWQDFPTCKLLNFPLWPLILLWTFYFSAYSEIRSPTLLLLLRSLRLLLLLLLATTTASIPDVPTQTPTTTVAPTHYYSS